MHELHTRTSKAKCTYWKNAKERKFGPLSTAVLAPRSSYDFVAWNITLRQQLRKYHDGYDGSVHRRKQDGINSTFELQQQHQTLEY